MRLIIAFAFIAAGVFAANLAIQPQDLVGSWRDMTCTWGEIGGYDIHADMTFEWGCGYAQDAGTLVFHPPDKIEIISYGSDTRRTPSPSRGRWFQIERFAFRRLHLRSSDGKHIIWIKDRKT
jgi:hypothetical protein